MKNVYNYHIREKNLTCTSKQTAVQTRRCLSALLDGHRFAVQKVGDV